MNQEYSVIVDPAEPYKNERASYAYDISDGDKDFVLLLNSENGSWSHTTKSTQKYFRDGQWWSDEGMCQVSRYYHLSIILDPQWEDWRYQVDKCLELYRGGTTFHGWKHRHERGKNIVFNQ